VGVSSRGPPQRHFPSKKGIGRIVAESSTYKGQSRKRGMNPTTEETFNTVKKRFKNRSFTEDRRVVKTFKNVLRHRPHLSRNCPRFLPLCLRRPFSFVYFLSAVFSRPFFVGYFHRPFFGSAFFSFVFA